MSSPKLSTIKRLYAVSHNQCTFPGCRTPLVESSGTVTGEIAHIKAASKEGPRYDSLQTEEQRHAYDNLILLCGRHHKLIDTEHEKYTVEKLFSFKNKALGDIIELTPYTTTVAQSLLEHYQNLSISNNSGQIAINSPGAVQGKNVNIKVTKQKISLLPPDGAIANNLEMSSYIEYLISKYNDFQKLDLTKEGRYKYIAIFNAIKREFGSKWQLVPSTQFNKLSEYLTRRIDNTKAGRIRKKNSEKNYHSFAEHILKINGAG